MSRSEWKPRVYMPLFAREHHEQASLFASPEPSAEPKCEHPEFAWQRDLFGETALCCTFCGVERGDVR